MNLYLKRKYYDNGTEGILTIDQDARPFCYTIELPWIDNERGISCIPAGIYVLQKRYSKRFKWHLHVQDVPDRTLILIHPANDAKKELKGCIAPVLTFGKPGTGSYSRLAFEPLIARVFAAIEAKETIFLIIDPPYEAEEDINRYNEEDHQKGKRPGSAIL